MANSHVIVWASPYVYMYTELQEKLMVCSIRIIYYVREGPALGD